VLKNPSSVAVRHLLPVFGEKGKEVREGKLLGSYPPSPLDYFAPDTGRREKKGGEVTW
jgi:hypothetical protein